MKEQYFEQVISEISDLCNDLKNENERLKSKNNIIGGVIDFSDITLYEQLHENGNKLHTYLTSLSDTTLNTICALMEFGRMYNYMVLPINLNKVFNKYYLPYWFNINKDEEKSMTALYLANKHNVLPRYLNRAKNILFYSKQDNIPLTHDCGGYLYLEESDGIVPVDYDTYELNLKCLKCNSSVIKTVTEEYLEKRI